MRLQLKWVATLFVVALQFSFAQEKKVSGIVTDESGVPLPGATILVKGEMKGTQTDFDGNYTIDIQKGKTLVFSYVGMKSVEKVVGNSSSISVVLKMDAQELDAVVITGALGLKRKPKEMSYSVASVKSDDITEANSVNAASSMVGKVSGLQINVVNNGVNPDTRVVLRGYRSLLNNNQALIVVDGFPSTRGVLDRINPNDIAEVTVLKGANASALYGSEASNGVLVITTKKGKSKLSVTLNSSVEIESISYMPEIQEEFGVGLAGVLEPLENVNWGPRYDGRMIDASLVLKNGESWKVPFSPIKDNYRSFFNDGFAYRNGFVISSGNEGSDILFSVDRLDKTGIVPKDEYSRTNVRLNASKKLGGFEFSGNFSFFKSKSDLVSNSTGHDKRPIYWAIINTPLHIPITQMKNWKDGKFTRNETSYYRFYENPYFLLDTNRSRGDFNEFTFIGSMKYSFTDWLSAQLRVGYTNNNSTFKSNRSPLEYSFKLPNAIHYIEEYGAGTADNMSSFSRLNSDFIININKNISEIFNISANIGQNVRMDQDNKIEVSGNNLIIPDFFNVSTRSGDLGGRQSMHQYRKVGVFGDFTFGFNDFLFLNASMRNDWTSSLSKEHRSYFYPGGGVSVILSNALPMIKSDRGLSYLKLSGNITKSGNDPKAYVNKGIFYSPNSFPYGALAGLSQSAKAIDPNLRPEFTTSMELGLEFALFRNRVTSNVTLYKTLTTDQIIETNISRASGASILLTNLGAMENKGLELDLNGAIIKNDKFSWNVGLNYSGYSSEVLSLKEGVEELSIGGIEGVSIVAKVGEAYPQLKATAWERDELGRVIVNDEGDPKRSSEMKIMGKTTPDYVLGMNTTLKYENFKLYVTADYRTGHVFYNNLADGLEFSGLTKHSVSTGRKPFVYPNSSYSDGNGGYIANNDRLTSEGGKAFWLNLYKEVKENYVIDATVLKIREITLSYDFNEDKLKGSGLNNLNIALYARNPFTFRPKANVYTDPEFNSRSDNRIGIGDQTQTPPTRQLGLKLTAKF